jgi:DNA-binding MarR family transcriptional regulator
VSFNAVDAVIEASFDRDRFTNAEFRLLVVLARHHNRRTGRCDPGSVRLSEETGLARSHVVKLLRDLEHRGEITPDGSGKGGRAKRQQFRLTLQRNCPVREDSL